MNKLEKNVYFDDVKVVYWTKAEGCDPITLFITKEDAIEFTKKYMEECPERNFDCDAEDYIEEIELDLKEERAATDSYGNVIVELLNPYSGKWEQCVF